MREQVGHFDVKVQIVYRLVARVKLLLVCVISFCCSIGRRDNLTLKPNSTIGYGYPTPQPFNIFCKLRGTISSSVSLHVCGSFALHPATGRGVNDAEGNRIPRLSID